MAINKGFIKDWLNNTVLPITRSELVLDREGRVALTSNLFLAGEQTDENGNLLTDAQGNPLPGLITAAERAMLTGGGNGGGIADLYTKLGYINTGLQFGGTTLNFFNAAGNATPINITSIGEGLLNISLNGNSASINLKPIASDATEITKILKSIKVDKFGRVTEVTGDALTNAEIPEELTGKKIKNGKLDNCETLITDVPEVDNAIVNKAYVDAKILEVTGKATGALKFKGVISDATTASNLLNNRNVWNGYYKITGEFTIPESDLEDTNGLKIESGKLTTQVGDTAIIYQSNSSASRAKFVYIPSGDDITALTVKCDADSTNALNRQVGNLTLQFSQPFTAKNSGNTAYIILPEVSTSSVGGYLSISDYNEFKSLSGSLKVSYTGEITAAGPANVYKIGTLTIGTTENIIYGKYNISSLSLENGTGTDTSYNPILKFTETGAADVKLTLKGLNGIVVKKNGNDVEFSVANEIIPVSQKYLNVTQGYKFGVTVGSLTEGANNEVTINDGLTDYAEFANFRANVLAKTTIFQLVTNSLTDTTKDLHYGSTKLVEAITLTI